MSQDFADRDDDVLDATIAEFRRMPIPDTPATDILLERVPIHEPWTTNACRRVPLLPTEFSMRKYLRIAAITASLAAIVVMGMLASPSENVALAQVIEATTKHAVARCNLRQVGEFKGEIKDRFIGNATTDYIMFIDLKSPRMRLDRPSSKTLNGVAEQSWVDVLDFEKNRVLQIYRFDLIMTEKEAMGDAIQTALVHEILGSKTGGPHQRTSKLHPLPKAPPPYADLGKNLWFLEKLRILQRDPKTAVSKDKLGGVETVQYSLQGDGTTSAVWVDPRTKLPVRIEHEVVGEGAGATFSSIKWLYTDFEWDPKIENSDTLFSIQPPDGYTLEDLTAEK